MVEYGHSRTYAAIFLRHEWIFSEKTNNTYLNIDKLTSKSEQPLAYKFNNETMTQHDMCANYACIAAPTGGNQRPPSDDVYPL